MLFVRKLFFKGKLLKLNDFSIGRSTVSAFIQSRSKIKVNAFNILFDQFNKKTHINKLWKGNRLIAINRSELSTDNIHITIILKILVILIVKVATVNMVLQSLHTTVIKKWLNFIQK